MVFQRRYIFGMVIIGILVVGSRERYVLTRRGSNVTNDLCLRSGIGKEHPLVRHSIFSMSYTKTRSLDQLCNHPTLHHAT